MGTGNAIYYYYYFSKKKKERKRKERKEKKNEQEKEREKKERKLNKRKKEITESYFFVIFFFILINQIGGNLDSSVDIAPNQDVDISVSLSLGPRSALWENGAKIGVGEKKGSLGGEKVSEPGELPLMPPIRPPVINLPLKC